MSCPAPPDQSVCVQPPAGCAVTVTVKLAVPVLPAASVAVQLTVVGPTGNRDPEAGTQAGVRAPSTSSVALAVNVTTAPVGPVAGTVMSAGTVTTGGVVSTPYSTSTVDTVVPTLILTP